MFEKYYSEIQNIEGWFAKEEAKIFYETINKLTGKASMLEIGSWCGRSLIFSALVANANGNNCKKYSIDPFITSKNEPNGKYETFINNLKKYNLFNEITHIKEKSNDVGKNFNDNIEFLFIDGFHVYEYVKKDFELFSKHVIENGYILIHDVSTWFGPTQLIYDIANSTKNIQILEFKDLTVLMRKNSNLSKADKLKNNEIAIKIKNIIETNNIQLKK